MATILFTVKATITPDQEEAFNRWYNAEHIPDLLRVKGAVGARRFKAIMGEDRYQYLAIYEFESQEAFQGFLESDNLARQRQEYEAKFGNVSERVRSAWVQVWP